MDERQKKRLKNYFKNSARPFWGVIVGNQKKLYDHLESKGLRFARGSYYLVYKQLLTDPDIEGLLETIIAPKIKETFPKETLDKLREYWQQGRFPSLSEVRPLRVNYTATKDDKSEDSALFNAWRPFLEINLQYQYVERWGELAGIWFEEIEP